MVLNAMPNRFFELIVTEQQQGTGCIQTEFVSFETLKEQHPDVHTEIAHCGTPALKKVYVFANQTEFVLREISEATYIQGCLQVRLKKLRQALDPLLERSPCSALEAATYNLTLGNLSAALLALSPYPDLANRLAQIIEGCFPTAQLAQERQRQGFTVSQLSALSGIAPAQLERLEQGAECVINEKACLMQHLFAKAFR